jgi:ferritin-like metal-binding protein YciE
MAKSSKQSTSKQSASSKKSAEQKQTGSQEPMLAELFYEELKDIYWAEKHLTKALPKMAKAASTEELKDAINEHLEVTQTQVQRLEKVFELLGKKAQAKKCEAMEGLTKEAESVIEDTEDGSATRDVALILASQKVEHYEIATYGGLATLAATLGLEEIKELLGETLAEEKEADTLLTDIAENSINYQAAEESEEEE